MKVNTRYYMLHQVINVFTVVGISTGPDGVSVLLFIRTTLLMHLNSWQQLSKNDSCEARLEAFWQHYADIHPGGPRPDLGEEVPKNFKFVSQEQWRGEFFLFLKKYQSGLNTGWVYF